MARGHGLDGALLQRAERVDNDALGAGEVGATPNDAVVGRVSRSIMGSMECVAGNGGMPGTCTSSSPMSRKLAVVRSWSTERCRNKARTSALEVKE